MLSLVLWTVRVLRVADTQMLSDESSPSNELQRVKLRQRLNLTEEQKAKAASLLGSLERLHRRLQITRWCIAMLSSNVGKKEKKVRDSRIF